MEEDRPNLPSEQVIPVSIASISPGKFDGLTPTHMLAYGVGHLLNDLTAACWFNYLLFFLKTVVVTPAAPFALLAGQVCDGIATPLVGYFSDKGNSFLGTHNTNLGRRTPWYIAGVILVSTCFIPIFQSFRSEYPPNEFIYYTVFPGLFNVGWACLQISHMSLAPALTCSRKRRDKLNNYRNTFSFISNFLVLALGLIVFALMNDKLIEYRFISYAVVGIGLSASLFFLYHIKEVELTKICQDKKNEIKEKIRGKKSGKIEICQQESNTYRTMRKEGQKSVQEHQDNQVAQEEKFKTKNQPNLKKWLLMPRFYLFGLCYMCVRLNSNIFGTFLPFFLVGVLQMGGEAEETTVPFSLALVPLIAYFSSTLVSLKLSVFYQKIGRKKALLIGTLIGTISLGSLLLLRPQIHYYIYPIAIFIGCSQSMVLATGINFISDVIGTKTDSGAFVFGVYSFLDKISAGILIYLIANTQSFSRLPKDLTDPDIRFITYTVVLLPIFTCLFAAAIVLLFTVSQYVARKDALSESKLERDEFVHSITIN